MSSDRRHIHIGENMKKNLNNFLNFSIIGLMIITPILDMRFWFNRITTLIQVMLIGIILLVKLITNQESRKNFWKLLIFYLLSIIYLIINYFRSKNFNSYFVGNFNYSIYKETLTIIKLLMPLTLLFILKYSDISKKAYTNIIKYWTIYFSLIIIVTDIFKIGYGSYSDQLIKYNMFDWINKPYYFDTACKGFFNYANQVACILVLLLITNVYNFFKNKTKNITYVILLSLAMITLGTRISTLGGLLVLICICLLTEVYKKINKITLNKKRYLIIIPILLWILLIPISPYSNRNIELNKDKEIKNYENSNTNDEESLKNDKSSTKIKTDNEEIQFYTKEDLLRQKFDKEVNNDVLPERFYKEIYSYYNDPYFWNDFIDKNNINDINYRLIEISIIKRIKTINDNPLDDWFGISNSRIQNVVNVERDFQLQFYAYGIIGCLILLLTYPILLIKSIRRFFNNKSLESILQLVVVTIFILMSFLSGNILNFLTCTIPMIFIFNYYNLNEKEL